MKFNYLFVDQHSGHETTFHPFTSNTSLTQERVTDLLLTIPGADRSGTNLGHLLEVLDKESVGFSQVQCPCCEKTVHSMKSVDYDLWERIAGIKWTFLNGFSGNY
jgi:hypothetical protein